MWFNVAIIYLIVLFKYYFFLFRNNYLEQYGSNEDVLKVYSNY